mmetsp:Transcript_49817/g.125489  ORF Transcript_49817/g.125489 Transcript_49817/m.125489 type:complete len:389 (+) Transcript_49817:62-1228(+)
MAAMLQFCVQAISCCSGDRHSLVPLNDDTPTNSEASICSDSESLKCREVVALAEDLLPGRQMSAWQRSWCTAETVQIYLRGRQGDVHAAAKILAEALEWRGRNQDILSGSRMPQWQSDLRVLTCAESGQPILYICFRHVVAGNIAETLAHTALALEAGVLSLRGGAQEFDIIVDCHGFGPQHLDPRPLLPFMAMIKQPYRDRMRSAILVGAPMAFNFLYKVASRFANEKTRRKAKFMSVEEAVTHFRCIAGRDAARVVEGIMASNRQGMDCQPGEVKGRHLPSELDDAASPSHRSMAQDILPTPMPMRSPTVGGEIHHRGFVHQLEDLKSSKLPGKVAHASGSDHGSASQGLPRISAHSRQALEMRSASEGVVAPRWSCCRRRGDRRA